LGASGLEARPIVKRAFLGVPYLRRPDDEKRSAENHSDSVEQKKRRIASPLIAEHRRSFDPSKRRAAIGTGDWTSRTTMG
jgi:hypothetical protein